MTITKMQRLLSRVLRDLDAIETELWERRFPYDLDKAERASAIVGQICLAFLDESELENLSGLIGGLSRPEPGLVGMPSADDIDEADRLATEKARKLREKNRVVKRTVTTATGKVTLLESKPRKPAKRKQAA